MRVLVGARDPAKGEAAAREMARGGFDVEAVTLDVSDPRSIEALADRLGEVDVLINNAGIDYDADQTVVSAVNPGWVSTDMGGRGGRPLQNGAASVVWAAMLPDNGPTGGFFRDGLPLAW
jgi:NAD(P)-dependent dehydrogenase (short-subunit alcohol dehydrogenase family)